MSDLYCDWCAGRGGKPRSLVRVVAECPECRTWNVCNDPSHLVHRDGVACDVVGPPDPVTDGLAWLGRVLRAPGRIEELDAQVRRALPGHNLLSWAVKHLCGLLDDRDPGALHRAVADNPVVRAAVHLALVGRRSREEPLWADLLEHLRGIRDEDRRVWAENLVGELRSQR